MDGSSVLEDKKMCEVLGLREGAVARTYEGKKRPPKLGRHIQDINHENL
jgi:hypothetical protein